ncbi:hypothetical protein QR680_005783 [Steinernema hermaphroditum]|uniref:Apple domain-containing protein n=1 Tax=Steinernema hermaphroditum TaxID=289476 RepID=A0AA39HUN3_9BILA|nr:hypothetical protein QR680_005783 [Steinernema hermaphroditum]
MFLLPLFFFFTSTSALLRNPNRCFYKTIGPKGEESVGRARNASTVLNLAECFAKCLQNRRCRLLAFNKQTNLCSLNPVIGSKLSISADALGFAFRKVCLGPSISQAREIMLRKTEILKAHLLRVAQWLESRLRAILTPPPEDDFFEGEPMRDSPVGNACFERTPGKVLIGVVDQLVQDIATEAQCEELCTTECIVASQNRKEMPELFTDDQNAVYIENICVGGGKPSAPAPLPIPASAPAPAPSSSTDNLSEKLAVRPPTSDTKDYGSDFDPFESSKTPAPIHIEASGYDTGASPSIAPHIPAPMPPPPTHPPMVVEPKARPHETVLTHTERRVETPPPLIEPKVIDTYNVDSKKTVVSTNDVQSYRRRLRDPKIHKCFTQIFAKDVVNERVVRSYSLEQCIDICRLCEECLPGGKCNRVAFSIVNHFCALGSSHVVVPTLPRLADSAFVQFKRTNC